MVEQQQIPIGMQIGGQLLRYSDIHINFATTEPGQVLASRTRWDRYKPLGLTNSEWRKMFGPDVDNLQHMWLTYGQTRWFLKECQNPSPPWSGPVPEEAILNLQEQEDLMLAATDHDWAEAITGDKMHDLKTEEERLEEARQFKILIAQVYGGEESTELATRIERVAEETEDKSTKLGRAFNAIERVGFLSTGLRAWRISGQMESDELRNACLWMASNAMGNQLVKLIEFSRTYPPVLRFLDIHNQTISDLLSNMPDDIFSNYTNEKERCSQVTKFLNAREAWSRYGEKHN